MKKPLVQKKTFTIRDITRVSDLSRVVGGTPAKNAEITVNCGAGMAKA